MDLLLLALTIGLPLIKIILFPARAVGRGGSWTIVGAVMIVGLMMALWFGVQSMTGAGSDAAATPAATTTASSAQDDAQQKAEEQQMADALAKYL